MNYPYDYALFAARNRNAVHEAVIKAIEQVAATEGITRKDIAKKMGRSPAQVSAWLSGPSNWTVDTISDLLRTVGASMDYAVVFDKDRDATKSNRHNRFEKAVPQPIQLERDPHPKIESSSRSIDAVLVAEPA